MSFQGITLFVLLSFSNGEINLSLGFTKMFVKKITFVSSNFLLSESYFKTFSPKSRNFIDNLKNLHLKSTVHNFIVLSFTDIYIYWVKYEKHLKNTF